MPKANSNQAPVPAEQSMPSSYEEALQELEQLLAKLESGQLPLDQLIVSYQRGSELLAYCQAKLQQVEQQIKVLDDGLLKPWNPSP